MIGNLLITLGLRTDGAAVENPAPGAGEKTVLVIDGNTDGLHAMSVALAGESYRLETVDTAEAAILKLASFRPDLILLDSRVSGSNGRRLAAHLIADEELVSVPIVAMTEMGTGGRGHPAPDGRFDGHIDKPINPDSLAGQVRAFLELPGQAPPNHSVRLALPGTQAGYSRQQASEVLEAITAGLPGSQFAPGTLMGLHCLATAVEGFPHCDLADYFPRAEKLTSAATARARSRFRSVIRLCRELVERPPDVTPGLAALRAGYIKNRRAEMEGLEHSLNDGDFAALRKAGHNLKGTGASYGFAELTDIGRALEAAAKENDATAVEILLDQIEAYISIVRPLSKN